MLKMHCLFYYLNKITCKQTKMNLVKMYVCVLKLHHHMIVNSLSDKINYGFVGSLLVKLISLNVYIM